MKPRKFLSVALAVLLFSFVVVPSAMADVDVWKCQVVLAGYHPTLGPLVQLIDLSTPPKWTGPRQFYLSPDLGNQGLATLLTAFSMGRTIVVKIAGTATSGSLIKTIFINNS